MPLLATKGPSAAPLLLHPHESYIRTADVLRLVVVELAALKVPPCECADVVSKISLLPHHYLGAVKLCCGDASTRTLASPNFASCASGDEASATNTSTVENFDISSEAEVSDEVDAMFGGQVINVEQQISNEIDISSRPGSCREPTTPSTEGESRDYVCAASDSDVQANFEPNCGKLIKQVQIISIPNEHGDRPVPNDDVPDTITDVSQTFIAVVDDAPAPFSCNNDETDKLVQFKCDSLDTDEVTVNDKHEAEQHEPKFVLSPKDVIAVKNGLAELACLLTQLPTKHDIENVGVT